jgi:hypothetical protein
MTDNLVLNSLRHSDLFLLEKTNGNRSRGKKNQSLQLYFPHTAGEEKITRARKLNFISFVFTPDHRKVSVERRSFLHLLKRKSFFAGRNI